MKAVISVIGEDQVRIVYAATGPLVDHRLGIIDINRTLMDDYFIMVMLMNLSQCQVDFGEALADFDALGEKMSLEVRVQHEDIFTAIHQI